MLSPSLVSLICALLLCLPLAVLFTITSPTTPIIAPRDSLSPPTPIRIPIPEDDESLLRAASRVNSRPIPRTGPRKVAFMFLTTSPLPFAPLWELFFAGANKSLYNIYVHADPTRIYDPPFSGVFSGRTIRSELTQRLSPSLTSAARRLLAHALLDDSSNSVFALLSPSCVPLHCFRFTWSTLAWSKKSFIEILENEIGSYYRWAARGPEAMLPESRLEDFRIGSQFWALTRKHARVVVRDRKLWAKYSLQCVTPENCYPEENYFPTLLNKYDPNGCVRATLTHVDWTGREDGHPRTYEALEVGPELILGLRAARPRYGDEYFPELLSSSSLSSSESSGASIETPDAKEEEKKDGNKRHDPFLFARKFAPETLEPLMSIARDVILRD